MSSSIVYGRAIAGHCLSKNVWEMIAMAEAIRAKYPNTWKEAMKVAIGELASFIPERPVDALQPNRRIRIVVGLCVYCRGQAIKFKDEASKKEFGITGFCQKCQDEVFE